MRISLLLLLLLLATCTHDDTQSPPAANGLVSSASPEATLAGRQILDKGGNAADAAVAIAFALGVTEPAMSGLGGGTQVLLSIPGKDPIAINGTTLSPALTPVTATKADLTYHKRSTIPSTVKVLHYLWKKYGSGTIEWAELLEPAIGYAEQGFVVGTFRHLVYKKYEKELLNSPYHTYYWLTPEGRIPAPGERIRQPVLATTLRRLAQQGAADFYSGDIAREIASDMAKNGGWITLEDLQNFPEPSELPALHTTFRDYDVFSQPPPCGGWTVLQILNLLEESPTATLLSTDQYWIKLTTALYLGHLNRDMAPVTDLSQYEPYTRLKTSKDILEEVKAYWPPSEQSSGGETTHFSVVDDTGMALAVTASINAYFGAAAASSKLGFLYNTYMDDFQLGQPSHPFAIGPRKMAYSSMSPTVVRKDGQNVLILGSPGSSRIISTVAQIARQWMDAEKKDIQACVAAPRVHVYSNKVLFEALAPSEQATILPYLEKQGMEIAFPTYDLQINGLNAYFGGVHALAWENGQWKGAADPRRDGLVQ
jgi:gamma-glutamyltranspeptidase/glutathione hydrolase